MYPSRIALLIFTLIASNAIHAADYTDLRRTETISGDATAGAQKVTACVACHGPNGNAVIPMFPNLAGQRVGYLYQRLVAYKKDDPNSSPMPAQVASLSDQDMRDIAVYFASQTPKSGSVANGSTDDRGAALFLHGDARQGVPACQGCHGADARGSLDAGAQYAVYPALRGQHAAYVAGRLTAFKNGVPQKTTSDFIMHGVAQTLDDGSIKSIAAWLDGLPAADVH